MEAFAIINGKYVELRPDDDDANSHGDADNIKLVEEFSQTSLVYERKAAKRKYSRGVNHIACGSAVARKVIKAVFVALLKRLTKLNDYLHELMQGHRARVLEQTIERTYLEMVQVCASVEELTQLVNAALLLDKDGSNDSSISATRRRSNMALASLAKFKILNTINDDPRRVKAPRYDAILESGRKRYSQIS